MIIKPRTEITYECYISDDDLRRVLNMFFSVGTKMQMSFCIYEQERPSKAMYLSIDNHEVWPSFCNDVSNHCTLAVRIGSIAKAIVIVKKEDMAASLSAVKNAIKKVCMEDDNIQDMVSREFESKFEIKFELESRDCEE